MRGVEAAMWGRQSWPAVNSTSFTAESERHPSLLVHRAQNQHSQLEKGLQRDFPTVAGPAKLKATIRTWLESLQVWLTLPHLLEPFLR